MELPLYIKNRQVGTVQAEAKEGETLFTVTVPRLAPGLWRITLQGTSGEVLLGVTETGTLRRRLSRQLLSPAGQLRTARAESGGGGWHTPEQGEIPGRLPMPQGALCCRCARNYLVALPWEEERPFPLVELFCLARMRRMQGRSWAVFSFDERGEPILPE